MMLNNPLLPKNNSSISGANYGAKFPSPFLDIASFMLPSSLKEALDLCTMFWLKHGTYRSAAQRIVRYFITEPEFTQDEDNRSSLKSFLEKDFNVTKAAAAIGDDLLSCGMTASSVIFPFNRFLACPKCHQERFIDNISWEYQQDGFRAGCTCGFRGVFKVVDRKSFDKERVVLQRWNPYELLLQRHPYSKRLSIQWDIPADIRQKTKAGDKFIVRDMPLEVLTTIKENKVLQFNPQFVFYEAEDTLASVDLKGYGLPRLMSNFAQAYYVQMLKRGNEALAQDYIVPFRLLSPAEMPVDGQNPWQGSVGSELVNQQISAMIDKHRRDPTTWNFSPIPMNYTAFGGEGQTMATPQLLEQGINELLNASGLPVELYKGTISAQAAPMGLRILQQSWPELASTYDKWLEFVVWQATRYMNWETPESIRFRPVTLADDLERRQLLLQLASANMVSKQTAYSVWGIDPKEEQEQILEEMRSEQEAQREFSEDMQNQEETHAMLAQSGQIPGGMVGDPNAMGPMGAPMGGSPYEINTVSGRAQQIEQTAQELVSMPYEARRSQMLNIKKSDPEMHALVKAKMEEIRSAARSQGSMQLSQGGM